MIGYDDTDWSLMDFEPPKKPAAKPLSKGDCPKCGKHIGKGAHFHIMACDGNPRKAD